MREFLEEYWWILLFVVIAVIAITLAVIFGVNDGSFDVIGWTANPANPASPLHQILP